MYNNILNDFYKNLSLNDFSIILTYVNRNQKVKLIKFINRKMFLLNYKIVFYRILYWHDKFITLENKYRYFQKVKNNVLKLKLNEIIRFEYRY